jgi:hypothetical protein
MGISDIRIRWRGHDNASTHAAAGMQQHSLPRYEVAVNWLQGVASTNK